MAKGERERRRVLWDKEREVTSGRITYGLVGNYKDSEFTLSEMNAVGFKQRPYMVWFYVVIALFGLPDYQWGQSGGGWRVVGGRVKQRKKSGNNFNMLGGRGGKLVVACTRMLAVQVVRSGQILGIFCSKEITGCPDRLKMRGEYSSRVRDHSQVHGTTSEWEELPSPCKHRSWRSVIGEDGGSSTSDLLIRVDSYAMFSRN